MEQEQFGFSLKYLGIEKLVIVIIINKNNNIIIITSGNIKGQICMDFVLLNLHFNPKSQLLFQY